MRLAVTCQSKIDTSLGFLGTSPDTGKSLLRNRHRTALDTSSIESLVRQKKRAKSQKSKLPEPQVHSSHPTMDLISQRFSQGSRPGRRSDPYKLGLVVEGGGMRGIISGAMLMELKKLGLDNTFDAIYGASAGAINATYYLAGQGQGNGLEVYTQHLATPEFVNPKGLKQRKPVLNLEYLFDHVMQTVLPLDWEKLLSSPVPLKIVASSLDRLGPVLLENFRDRHELVDCLKASATVPHLVGPPRLVRGERLVDAAMFEPIPVESAILDGCTHVLVLCTRTCHLETGVKHRIHRQVIRAIKHAWLTRPPYHTPRDFTFRDTSYQLRRPLVVDDFLVSTLDTCPHEVKGAVGGFVLPIYPTSTHGLHPLCVQIDALDKGKVEGASAIQRVFASLVAEPVYA